MRAEIDAAMFHLYGIGRDDVDYIMETFPIVKRKDVADYGEYRTKRLILGSTTRWPRRFAPARRTRHRSTKPACRSGSTEPVSVAEIVRDGLAVPDRLSACDAGVLPWWDDLREEQHVIVNGRVQGVHVSPVGDVGGTSRHVSDQQ